MIVFYAISLLIAAKMCHMIYNQAKEIEKLHYENQNYLILLSHEDILPEAKVKEKIQQMNEKYGKIKLKIK